MDIGMSLFFQSPDFMAEDGGQPAGMSDLAIMQREIALGDLAEPLGFDSLWTVEHHFSGYTMMPDPMQLLAHMAGRTKDITLGSMVVVLPWYDQPVRVAESISLLDNLAGGRLIFGIGRGLGRVEFGGLGVPMDESRERFVESAELILRGLERGWVEYDGKHYQQEKRWIRPQPTRSFRGRTFAAAVSPESSKIMAELGVGLITLPQKGWDKTREDMKNYSDLFESIHGEPPPPSKVCCPVFVDEDEGRARDLGLRYICNYYESVMRFYELAGRHFEGTAGYEHYAAAAKDMARRGEDAAGEFYAGLQVYGTPDQCVDKIAERRDILGADTFLGVFSYGGMDWDEVMRNVHLFTDKVAPRVKTL